VWHGSEAYLKPLKTNRRLGFDKAKHFQYIRIMEEKEAITALAALAQGMRLRLFRVLIGAAPLGMTPGELAATLDVPSSTLSFHLKELMHAGLVTQVREGRNLIYQPCIEHMNSLLVYLTAHCCQGSPGTACEVVSTPDCQHC
jgi:ArsR family transcriptional regulator, arsenate/arsenite/antimonite-responsive transcriptional repressor